MNCTFCDAANADSANFCSQCGVPMPARECHACGAFFDKSANECPKCGEAVPSAAGGMSPATEPSVAAAPSATVAPSALALAGDAQLMDRLVKLLDRIEGELATRRLASTPLDGVSPILISNSPAQLAHAVTPAKRPRRAPWLIAGGLVIAAAAGVLLYGSYDRGLLDRFLQQASTLTNHFPPRASALATHSSVPAQLAPIPTTSATTPAQVGWVEAPRAQSAIDDRANTVPTPTAPDEPASVPAEQARLDERASAGPTAAADSTKAAPDARTPTPIENEPGGRQSMLARSESVSSSEKAATSRTDQPTAHDDASAASTPATKPADDRGCRDNAISAMGLCETAQ